MVMRNHFYVFRTKEVNVRTIAVNKKKSSVNRPTWIYFGTNCRDEIRASKHK